MDSGAVIGNSSPFLPLLARLDRLECLMQVLAERHCLSLTKPCSIKRMKLEDHCKPISAALEEVQKKGSVLQRLIILEKRIFQLSLESDDKSRFGSTSSTDLVGKKKDNGLNGSKDEQKDGYTGRVFQENGDSVSVRRTQEDKQEVRTKNSRLRRKAKIILRSRWFSCS